MWHSNCLDSLRNSNFICKKKIVIGQVIVPDKTKNLFPKWLIGMIPKSYTKTGENTKPCETTAQQEVIIAIDINGAGIDFTKSEDWS